MNVKFYSLFFLIFFISYNISIIKSQLFNHLVGHALNRIDKISGKISDRITDRITGQQSSQYRENDVDDDVSIGGIIRRHRLRHKEQKKRLCRFFRNGKLHNGPCPGDEEIGFGQEYNEKYVEKNNHQGYAKEPNYNYEKQPNYQEPNVNLGSFGYGNKKPKDEYKQPNYQEPNVNLGSFEYGNKKPKDKYKQPNYSPEREPDGYALGNIKTPKFGSLCQTKEGLKGFCQPATFCFSQYNNLIEYDKNKCRQPNGLFGICCPKDFRKPQLQYCKMNFYVNLNNLIILI